MDIISLLNTSVETYILGSTMLMILFGVLILTAIMASARFPKDIILLFNFPLLVSCAIAGIGSIPLWVPIVLFVLIGLSMAGILINAYRGGISI